MLNKKRPFVYSKFIALNDALQLLKNYSTEEQYYELVDKIESVELYENLYNLSSPGENYFIVYNCLNSYPNFEIEVVKYKDEIVEIHCYFLDLHKYVKNAEYEELKRLKELELVNVFKEFTQETNNFPVNYFEQNKPWWKFW